MPRSAPPMRRVLRSRVPILVAALTLAATMSGCSALGDSNSGSNNNPQTGAPGPNGPLEKAKIKVAALPVVDMGPLYLAIENGYFKAEGLEVEAVNVASGAASIQGIISGEFDISFGSYPAAIAAQSKKVADLKIIAEALAAKPGHIILGAPPNSPVKKPQDLPGKRVAVTATGTMCDLAPMAVMESQNVDFKTIQWQPMAFPDMIPALQRGDIDAACLVEPWATRAAKQIGAAPVLDGASGPTDAMPMAGYVAVAGPGKFATANPNTIAAFQRAMAKAAAEAQDRSKIEPILIKHVKIDEQTAKIMTIATFSTSLDAKRIQRVADLMEHFGVIKEHLDVAPMIVDGSSSGK
jgi:NitT/TauT family transport system substrate-binding protein